MRSHILAAFRCLAVAALFVSIAGTAVAAGADVAAVDPVPEPWEAGTNWLVMRGGYAKSNTDNAGNGGGGLGFGFRHMLAPSHVNEWNVLGFHPLGFLHWTLFKRASLGVFADYDVLGRFGAASEIELSGTVDVTRHFGSGAARPYLGIGLGQFHRKTYKTGDDLSQTEVGWLFQGGMDFKVASNQVLGLGARVAKVDTENLPENPVFGPGDPSASHWGVKVSYGILY